MTMIQLNSVEENVRLLNNGFLLRLKNLVLGARSRAVGYACRHYKRIQESEFSIQKKVSPLAQSFVYYRRSVATSYRFLYETTPKWHSFIFVQTGHRPAAVLASDSSYEF